MADLRGFGLDVLSAGVVALVLFGMAGRFRAWTLVPLGLWCALLHGAYQNVLALQAYPNLSNLIYLSDATFVAGSVSDVRTLGTGLGIAVLALGLGACSFRVSFARRHLAALAVASAAGCALTNLWPTRDDVEAWRTTNPATEASTALLRLLASGAPTALAAEEEIGPLDGEQRALVESALRQDLSGERRYVAAPGTRPNVLLIVIEGLSGAFVPSLRSFHGAPGTFSMPTLDRLHREGYSVPNFIVHQRQTNRGMYSILSGQLPNLLSSSPKMSTFASRPEQRYLPQILKSVGYQTVFMQATDMSFMMMDSFMTRAGFDRLYGDKDFREATLRTGWGVDDRTLLRAAGKEVAALEHEGSRPWFVTVLTCGSHHPYGSLVPEDFPALPGEDDKARAFRFADHALGELLSALKSSGVLDHTLVIVTSDESSGSVSSPATLDRVLSSSWGMLAARLPGVEAPVTAEGGYGQSDIALSILDYLDLEEQAHGLSGRSFFRGYDSPRSLFFANNSARSLGVFHASGELSIVPEDRGGEAIVASFDPTRIFSVRPKEAGLDLGDTLISLGRRLRDQDVAPGGQLAEVELASGTLSFPHVREKNFQWVFGGQYLHFDDDVVLEFDVEMVVHTAPSNEVRIRVEHHHHSPDEGRRKRITSTFSGRVRDGERFHYRLIYRTAGDPGPMELNQYIESELDVPVALEVRRASMRPVPFREYPQRTPPLTALYEIESSSVL